MATITVNGRAVFAGRNERLAEVLRRAGCAVPLPCGGRGSCGKCRVTVDGREELACRYRVKGDVIVTVPEPETIVTEEVPEGLVVPGAALGCAASAGRDAGGPEITGQDDIALSASESERDFDGSGMVGQDGIALSASDRKDGAGLALALDIGTTTLALALVATAEKRIVRAAAGPNPQRSFGADVMSRIGYCREHGPTALQLAVVSVVNGLIRRLDAPPVETLYAAGNTAMLHLFFGVDCSGMGTAPYTPAFLTSRSVSAAGLGIVGAKTVVSLPCAAPFVGADLIAGLRFVGLPPAGKYDLLVDLGTNAEIILFSRDKALCTSAAAGPCFEGANISCGMSASPGAVYAYDAAGCRTVGDIPAKGICGTGLVDLIAALLADGTVDETGYLKGGSFTAAPGVVLTQNDVRQFQLAKAAVCAAILTLLKRQEVSFDEVDTLFIAGGFAAKINTASAAAAGLLPAALIGRCVPVGNSSLLGTVQYACGPHDLTAYASKLQYVDLAADPLFSELFIGNMMFRGLC